MVSAPAVIRGAVRKLKKTETAESAVKTETPENTEKSNKPEKSKKKNKKRRAVIFLIIFFLLGLLVFLYPVFTKYFINRNAGKEVNEFRDEMDRIISEAIENGELDGSDIGAGSSYEPPYMKLMNEEEPPEHQPYMDNLYQFMRQRNRELFDTSQTELNGVESYQFPEFTLKYYGVKTDAIGTLEIDKLGLDLSVYLGANDVNLAIGSGHLTNTSYYLGGKNTNCVIAVHRGLGGADFLRYVTKLENGDIVRIRNFWYTLEYKVTGVKITEPDDVKSVYIQSDKDILTLYTCHPYGINTQRYIVYCERVTE